MSTLILASARENIRQETINLIFDRWTIGGGLYLCHKSKATLLFQISIYVRVKPIVSSLLGGVSGFCPGAECVAHHLIECAHCYYYYYYHPLSWLNEQNGFKHNLPSQRFSRKKPKENNIGCGIASTQPLYYDKTSGHWCRDASFRRLSS